MTQQKSPQQQLLEQLLSFPPKSDISKVGFDYNWQYRIMGKEMRCRDQKILRVKITRQ